MMGHVYGPEQPYLMIKAMQPVIEKIFKHQEHDPIHDDIAKRKNLVAKKISQHKQVSTAYKKIETGIQQHKINIGSRVFPGISFFMTVIA